jgi:hypothetical protein
MKTLSVIIAGVLLFSTPLMAGNSDGHSKWSIGTSLTYPIAQIYQIHINHALNERHELFFGPAYQNFESGSITSHAFTLILGYRNYIWKNLHIEVELWPAWNRMYSSITGSYYPGTEMWSEIKLGYTFNVYGRMFIQPAPGIGFGIFRTNKPPDFSNAIKSPVFAPQVILGVRL